MMKLDRFLFLVILIFLLQSCSLSIFNKNSGVTKTGNLSIDNYSVIYQVKGKTLPVYQYDKDPNISYVNVSEFLSALSGAIVHFSVAKTSVMTLSYDYKIPVEQQTTGGKTDYLYQITLDANKDTVSYNDFDINFIMDNNTDLEYYSDFTMTDYKQTDGQLPVTIPLSDYNISIVRSNNNYYIPLDLANFLFTGPDLYVYEMNNHLYIMDYSTALQMLTLNYRDDDTKQASDYAVTTQDYLALYFDYFYGLKNFKGIDTYQSVLDKYNFAQATTFGDINKDISNFFDSQNDLHTNIVSGGYLDSGFFSPRYENQKNIDYNTAYLANDCSLQPSGITVTYTTNTMVLHVNSFFPEEKLVLPSIMKQAANYLNIVIDLGCNPGGDSAGVLYLLSYMTNQPIPISYEYSTTGTKVTAYYEPKTDVYLDKNYYVYTTAATYSAANLFTSIVKDEKLGQIFGENTGGGASAIKYTVLPDSAIIVSSSDLTLINQEGEIIENGISVDKTYSGPVDWQHIDTILNNLFD